MRMAGWRELFSHFFETETLPIIPSIAFRLAAGCWYRIKICPLLIKGDYRNFSWNTDKIP